MKLRRSILMAILTLSVGIAGCGAGKISGHVYDTDGKPLVGAVVKTLTDSKSRGETKTGEDGSFSIEIPSGLPDDKVVALVVSKLGYETHLNQFTYAEAAKQTDMKIVMAIGDAK